MKRFDYQINIYIFMTVMSQRQSQKESVTHTNNTVSSCSEFNFEDVCKPGNTLLWDLVQDDKAVSIRTCIDLICFRLYYLMLFMEQTSNFVCVICIL